MSFGGQSNAWQRNMMQDHPQTNSFHQGPPQMFMQTPQQSNMAAFGHGGGGGGGGGGGAGGGGGMYTNSGGGGSVSYPQPRSGLNPVAFQGSGGAGGGNLGQAHYNFIGTVTKINNDCGLVNNEVFFYRNVCKGLEPKLGDRVMFEASYSNSGQFKWNATRIQLMQPSPQTKMNSVKPNYSNVAPPNEYQRAQMAQRHISPKRVSPLRGAPIGGNVRHDRERHERERERDGHHLSRDREEDERGRKRRHDDHGRSRDRIHTTSTSRTIAPSVSTRTDRDRTRERERDSRRDKEFVERDREREKERVKERERPARDVEGRKSVVPKPRRGRPIVRYAVQIPKSLLPHKYADVQEIRNRYTTLYIPSDFFHANIKWTETFTPDNPFSLRRPCKFHIVHKMVEPPIDQIVEELEPADADYVYSAKVMLMALPPIADIYKKCFENNEDDLGHPSRLINFLVGVRGRNEPMAIGGPWSPSLDGENPDTDPSVLIRTAIRTCKALTGIDLSNCTQWYRFVELYYHRTEYKNMEKDGPPRVETVVVYLPDVHSCMPTLSEYQFLVELYKSAAENVIARKTGASNKAAAVASANDDEVDNNEPTNNVDDDQNAGGAEGEHEEEEPMDEDAEQNENAEDETAAEGENDESANADENAENMVAADEGENFVEDEGNQESCNVEGQNQQQMDESGDGGDEDMVDNDATDNAAVEAEDENEDPNPEPTHYSLLDLKSMKVQEIRDELLARDLSDKGVRNVVMARLAKALNTEKSEEMKAQKRSRLQQMEKNANAKKNSNGSEKDGKKTDKDDKEDWADVSEIEMSDMVVLDEYDASKNQEDKKMTKKEQAQIIRHYTLPATPQIVVHPNKLAKGGNFDCAVMSLSVLLDYHPEDTKERFFEVSLFAELFNEMLMRDFAFTIYKEIYLYKGNESQENEVKSETVDAKADSNGDGKSESTDEPPSKIRKRRMSTADGRESENGGGDKKTTPAKPQRRMSTVDGRDREIPQTDDKKIVPAKPQRRMSTVDGGKEAEAAASTDANKKTVVVKPQLLLSFLYFDSTHCGYIFERDLEDLFSVIGLNLSRSQIKKVLSKLGVKTSVYYRKLTDKVETVEATPCIEDIDNLPVEELQDIASGNNKYEFVFGEMHPMHCAIPIDGDEDNDADLINYNGTVIHVGKLVEQIKRTEKNYSDLEKIHNDLLKQHSDLRKDHTKTSSKIKDLQTDVKSLSRKLIDTNQDLYSLNRKYRDQNATLSYIYTRVSPYFLRDKEKEKEKEKEKDSKLESPRDKDIKDEKEKPKDKEKAAEKDKKPKEKETDKEKKKETADKDSKEQNKEKETEKDKTKEKPTEKETAAIKTEEKPDTNTEKTLEPEKANKQIEKGNKEAEKAKAVLEKPKEVAEKVNEVPEKAKEAPEKPKEAPEKPKEVPEKAKETVKVAPIAAKATPVKAAAAPKATQAKSTPAKVAVAKATPAKTVPAKATPAKATPAKANPTAVKKPATAAVAKKAASDNANKK